MQFGRIISLTSTPGHPHLSAVFIVQPVADDSLIQSGWQDSARSTIGLLINSPQG